MQNYTQNLGRNADHEQEEEPISFTAFDSSFGGICFPQALNNDLLRDVLHLQWSDTALSTPPISLITAIISLNQLCTCLVIIEIARD